VTSLSYERSFVLPRIHVSAIGENSTGLTQVLQQALKLKDPKAQVNSLRVEVTTSAWYNKTSTQWLNESLRFDVTGVNTAQGGIVQADLSWKSFNVSTGFPLGAAEVNRVGENYFAGVASDLAAHNVQNSFIQTSYQVNGVLVEPTQFPALVRNMTILDFSSFASPLSKWQESHAVPANVSWTLVGGKGLGMAMVQQVNEAGAPSTSKYGLFYDLAATVSAPRNTRVSGDTITLASSGFPEVVMGGIIISTVALWSGASLFERRIQNKTQRRKTKR